MNVYQIVLCEQPYIDAKVPQNSHLKATDCFVNILDIAREYLDFNKVMNSLNNPSSRDSTNEIDENEIAFKWRLDERIIPVGPKTDFSHVKITVEAEIYYKGNEHPTRRRLQGGAPGQDRRQAMVNTVIHGVHYSPDNVKSCMLHDNAENAVLDLGLDLGKDTPTEANVNEWALNMKMEVESRFDIPGSVRVMKVETCSRGCQIIYAQDRAQHNQRRLQAGGRKETIT